MQPDPQPEVDRIVADLRAALDAAERAAKAATPGPWKVDDPSYPEEVVTADHSVAVLAGGRWGGEARVFESTADALFIALNDPARVLALVAAHRELLDDLLAEQHSACAMTPDGQGACTCGRDQRVLRRVRLLAAAYAGRGERNVRDVLDRDEEG